MPSAKPVLQPINPAASPARIASTPSAESWKNPRLVGRLPELDGIRGLAILLVLIWHYFCASLSTPTRSVLMYLMAPIKMSWSGVDLFFVLSGFLIGGILLDHRNSQSYHKVFYSRRLFRIFPLYYLCIGLYAIGLALSASGRLNSAMQSAFIPAVPVWPYLTFTQNVFVTISTLSLGPPLLTIMWSLAVEEQFYLALPLIVRSAQRSRLYWYALAAILAAPVLRTVLLSTSLPSGTALSYTLTVCRADSLGVGFLAALLVRERTVWQQLVTYPQRIWLVPLACISLLGILAVAPPRVFYAWKYTLLALFYCSLLLVAVAKPTSLIARLFRNAALRQLGGISYAVYLLHVGVNLVLHALLRGQSPTVDNGGGITVTLLSLLTTVTIAKFSWIYFEEKLIRFAHSRFEYGCPDGSRREF